MILSHLANADVSSRNSAVSDVFGQLKAVADSPLAVWTSTGECLSSWLPFKRIILNPHMRYMTLVISLFCTYITSSESLLHPILNLFIQNTSERSWPSDLHSSLFLAKIQVQIHEDVFVWAVSELTTTTAIQLVTAIPPGEFVASSRQTLSHQFRSVCHRETLPIPRCGPYMISSLQTRCRGVSNAKLLERLPIFSPTLGKLKLAPAPRHGLRGLNEKAVLSRRDLVRFDVWRCGWTYVRAPPPPKRHGNSTLRLRRFLHPRRSSRRHQTPQLSNL